MLCQQLGMAPFSNYRDRSLRLILRRGNCWHSVCTLSEFTQTIHCGSGAQVDIRPSVPHVAVFMTIRFVPLPVVLPQVCFQSICAHS